MVHTGIGYDVHQLKEGRKLILGGVDIPHEKGLDGHSDADVLMHAICDAVLGALGKGDIGQFFPNTDPQWEGAPSRVFLEEAARQAKLEGARIVNVDAALMAERPKVLKYADEMKKNIGAALGIDVTKVGIKATTNETMGFAGREEGMGAWAVAAVDRPE
ncbi:2-C-methyl-D-erythritol 2,4-cyclodiphosphate synthase [bacterium]|nr:2-C-methyl-D-erythritol 2,4-cyclodiphosphate synthase [bacterium]